MYSQISRSCTIISGRALQLNDLAECMVQDNAVQQDNDCDGKESDAGREENELGRCEEDKPTPLAAFGISAPTECR